MELMPNELDRERVGLRRGQTLLVFLALAEPIRRHSFVVNADVTSSSAAIQLGSFTLRFLD